MHYYHFNSAHNISLEYLKAFKIILVMTGLRPNHKRNMKTNEQNTLELHYFCFSLTVLMFLLRY